MIMNRVIHFEIHASDTARVAGFYRAVFGWEIRKWDDPAVDYWFVMTAPDGSVEPGIDGGIVKREGPAPRGEPTTSCTIAVANVDEYIRKIRAAGGRNVVPRMPVPGMGWLAYCADIEGNVFGLFESDRNVK
jgi:predicted enzyme related to lactoylglutathione lyase